MGNQWPTVTAGPLCGLLGLRLYQADWLHETTESKYTLAFVCPQPFSVHLISRKAGRRSAAIGSCFDRLTPKTRSRRDDQWQRGERRVEGIGICVMMHVPQLSD